MRPYDTDQNDVGSTYEGNQQAPPPSSFVYPHPPSGSPKPPDKNHSRVIGLLAIFLAVAVLFAALGGGLAMRYLGSQQPSLSSQSSQSITTLAPTVQIKDNDKHWSVASAATRRDGDRTALSIIDIAAQGKPAVVAINTTISATDMFGQTGEYPAAGSGFIITSDGYLVTNNHVIEGANTITVVMENGNIYPATLVGSDSRTDLAVIKIDAEDLPTTYLGDSDDLQVGELAVAIGNPLGELSGSVTAGIISALNRSITLDNQTLNLLQTDAAINPGNSGGALFNSYGEVIGINTAKTSQTGIEGLGFAIPINDAKPIIENLINYGYVRGRTKIGISTRDVSAEMAEYYGMTEGVFISTVERGSPADKAGLRNEDTIIAANGQEAKTTADLVLIKDALGPDDAMVLTIIRNKREMTLTVILVEDVPVTTSTSGG